MPKTYRLEGISFIIDNGGNPSGFQQVTLGLIGRSTSPATLIYNYYEPGTVDTSVDIEGDIIGADMTGLTGQEELDAVVEQITTTTGTSQVLGFYDPATDREYFFRIGGDPLPVMTTQAAFNNFYASVQSNTQITSGPFAPNTLLNVADFPIVEIIQGNSVTGTAGDDLLNGTAGNDLIQGFSGNDTLYGGAGTDELIPGTNTSEDIVNSGTGDDLVDYGLSTYGFQILTYAGATDYIDVHIDGAANSGEVAKASNGYDRLIDVANALEANANPLGGLSIIGTVFDDYYGIYDLTEDQWINIQGGAGADSYNLNGSGTIRLSFNDAPTGVTLRLASGQVADDGFGNFEYIFGTASQIRTTSHNDNIIGSGQNETFILEAGTDTLDGGGGTDRVRYDRNGVDGVTVDLDAGTASGLWGGLAFNHSLTSIEKVRGSHGDDTITGSSSADTLEGRDGNDRLDGGAGNDSLYGENGADTLIGGLGDDFLFGGSSNADLRDVIYGGDGNDYIDGGYGNDELRGDAGNDTLEGGYGADTVIGGTGDDVLTGAAFGDIMLGGDGDDFINGGFGFDRVNGGTGADKFYHLGVAGHGSDWIQDYNSAEGDVLMFGGGAATTSDFLIQRASTPNAGAAGVQELFVTQISTGNLLWALVDGDAQAQINIQIQGQVFDLLA